jgi:hypothetical protein
MCSCRLISSIDMDYRIGISFYRRSFQLVRRFRSARDHLLRAVWTLSSLQAENIREHACSMQSDVCIDIKSSHIRAKIPRQGKLRRQVRPCHNPQPNRPLGQSVELAPWQQQLGRLRKVVGSMTLRSSTQLRQQRWRPVAASKTTLGPLAGA